MFFLRPHPHLHPQDCQYARCRRELFVHPGEIVVRCTVFGMDVYFISKQHEARQENTYLRSKSGKSLVLSEVHVFLSVTMTDVKMTSQLIKPTSSAAMLLVSTTLQTQETSAVCFLVNITSIRIIPVKTLATFRTH